MINGIGALSEVKIDCESSAWEDHPSCDKSKGTKTIDKKSGLEVIEFVKDIDWKSKSRDKLPYSKIVKVTSLLDGEYELAVFDRDYKSGLWSGGSERVVLNGQPICCEDIPIQLEDVGF